MAKQYWKAGNMLYPVPAVMVSCGNMENSNIITVAWAGTINTNPPMLSISVRPERYSYNIIKQSGDFVVNLVSKDLCFAADLCGVKSGADTDKFKEAGLHAVSSRIVSSVSIEESPVNIECKLDNIIPLGSHHMFIAKISGVTIDEKFMDKTGKFNLNDSNLVIYSHGEYFSLGEKLGKFGYSVKKTFKGNEYADNRKIRKRK